MSFTSIWIDRVNLGWIFHRKVAEKDVSIDYL